MRVSRFKDGKPDAGIIDGVNASAIGAIEFCRRLTERMRGKKALSRTPRFTYINHKFQTAEGDFDPPSPAPFSMHRLVLAGAVFIDSGIGSSLLPQTEPGELTSVWDEWRQGAEKHVGWLGKPLAPVAHLAEQSKNI